MIVYRMKHLPTGLYYRPSADVKIVIGGLNYYTKTNLSKKGKLYLMKPSFLWLKHGYCNHIQQLNVKMIQLLESENGKIYWGRKDSFTRFPFIESEWIIEEI